jgi:site-specific DNA recombinase
MANYCIYLRKSRADAEAEARGEGETLARHRAALVSLAERMGLPVSKTYREIVSGETIAARPVMRRLLSEVEGGLWDGVLVMEIERLARGDTIDQGVIARAFSLSHTKIVTPAKTYDPDDEFDEEYFEFGLFMSRREYRAINRRLQRGRRASALEGKYTGSVAPFGYVRVKLDGQKGYTLAPDPAAAPAVKLIFELYTKGDGAEGRLGVARLARRLNDLGIRPRRAARWTPSMLQPLLKNPVYAGKIRYMGRPAVKRAKDGGAAVSRPRNGGCIVVDGLHPPLIGREAWDRAQEYLSGGHPRGTRGGSLKNPLAGLVYCGVCGGRMCRKPYKNAPDALVCPDAACANVSSELRLVESAVLRSLKTWLRGYRLRAGAKGDTGPAPVEAAAAQALRRIGEGLARLEAQRAAAHDLLEQGVYDAETFEKRKEALLEQTEELRRQETELRRQLQAARARETALRDRRARAEDIAAAYALAPSVMSKNSLLRSLVERIDYYKAVRGGNGRARVFKGAFELVLYPRLPDRILTDNNAAPKNWPTGR